MGLIDRLDLLINGKKKDEANEEDSLYPVVKNPDGEDPVFIFLGWRKNVDFFEKLGLYDRFGDRKQIIYQIPNNLLSSNPNIGKIQYEKIKRDIIEKGEKYKPRTSYGMSLGSTLATIAANDVESVEQLKLCAPGDDLPEIIWTSPITSGLRKMAKKNEFTYKDYKEKLDKYSTINNLDNMRGRINDVKIFLAPWDSFITYPHGKEIANEISMSVSEPEMHYPPWYLPLGHLLGIRYNIIHSPDSFYE